MSEMRPSHYLVCATHRSGSNLLCQALWLSKLAGYPQECFSPTRCAPIAAEHGIECDPGTHFYEYVKQLLLRRRTENGVFGAKIMWKHVEWVRERVLADPEYTGPAGVDSFALLQQLFPGLRFVWMRRRDKVRQAISLWKAKQSKIYNSMQLDEREAVPLEALRFDFEGIDKEVRRFGAEDEAWGGFFAGHGVTPVEVVYEEFVKEYELTVLRVLDALEVAVPEGFSAPRTHYERLSDAVNDEWYAMYCARKAGV